MKQYQPFRLSVLVILFIFSGLSSKAQNKHTVSGYVKDVNTGEFLPGANAYVKETMQGTTTNPYGFYSLTLPSGKYTLVISFIGYNEVIIPIDLNEDRRENQSLSSKAIVGKEVVITESRIENSVKSTDMGRVELSVEQMKKLPAFFGEVDLVKIVQLIPGVKNAGEGNTGLYVRGGGPDQNLVLLDEAVVYNAAHLLGFFSVFNSDAVKTVDLHKGGMPAQYGGRLASVLDISMKEGNNRNYKVNGGLGLIASRLTVEGPIKKDTSSFIISGRRTYIDVLAQPFIRESSPTKGSGYFFYDLNMKMNYRLSDKDRLFVSGYFGRDVFTFKSTESNFNIRIPWGNATLSARWNHLFNDKLFLNTSLIFSDYRFESNIEQTSFAFRVGSGIRDYNAKSDFTWYPTVRHTVKFGINYIWHRFSPNNASGEIAGEELDFGPTVNLFAHEAAAYIADDFDISEKLRIHAGLRASWFAHAGPFTRYEKNDIGLKTDSTVYAAGELIKTYPNIEPRLMMRCTLNKNSSIKASYTQNYQYIHITSLANQSLPTDLWFPSTELVQPQFGTQYSLGYYRNFKENMWETSIEAYYKTMENQIEFKDGVLPSSGVNDNLDNFLTFGRGEAYGAEFFVKKAFGKTNGWIGYTLSWTQRTFAELNGGETYFANYDRRHDLSVVLSHELNEHWTLGAVFVYASGNLIWLPTSIYFYEGNPVVNYGERNNYRMPAYHRLDLSATWVPNRKPDKKLKSSWNFSIYNLYSRLNPYFLYLETTGSPIDGNLKNSANMVSLFPIIPSVTYNFSF
ncbi:MAG: TonB-dependent receptor [Bacteroidia bacterium]